MVYTCILYGVVVIISFPLYFQECPTVFPGLAALLGGPELPSKDKVQLTFSVFTKMLNGRVNHFSVY